MNRKNSTEHGLSLTYSTFVFHQQSSSAPPGSPTNPKSGPYTSCSCSFNRTCKSRRSWSGDSQVISYTPWHTISFKICLSWSNPNINGANPLNTFLFDGWVTVKYRQGCQYFNHYFFKKNYRKGVAMWHRNVVRGANTLIFTKKYRGANFKIIAESHPNIDEGVDTLTVIEK